MRQHVSRYEDLLTTVKKRKLRWYGHVTRASGLSKTILQGTVQGRRRRGRQSKKWIDNIAEWTSESCATTQALAHDRYSVSGIYTIFPAGFADGLRVYCDMETDGGGWLVIQRRQDGSVDFYRGWVDYRVGFGDLAGEFWLGNDNLRTLSDSSGSWDLRIDLEDWDGNTTWAEYGNFRIISGQDYRLSFDSYNANSTARNSLANHNHQPFSTKDKDNDSHNNLNCAEDEKGAWWYIWCSDSNLNGIYFYAPSHINFQGIIWSSWKGYSYSLKKCGMKIRRSMDYLQAA
ncbi:ficolin-1-like [Patiria miniata]|uniref:Fibrinogen C-terminal domain-containing protein n=1 Tax=Patiria miniata TaxID=46514 RepID=A0A913ZMU1_PATMI|nr:ficolin-1-like [Patiria miniata]